MSSSAPTYAPLSMPLMQHIAHQRMPTIHIPHATHADIDHARQQVDTAVQCLSADIQQERTLVTTLLSTHPHRNGYMKPGTIQTLLYEHIPIGQLTNRNPHHLIATWRERGILVPRTGPSTISSVAALIMTRILLADCAYGWLPRAIPVDTTRWWCWRQDSVETPPVPCPIPLPADLPPTALLWTPWAGVAWEDAAWWMVGNLESPTQYQGAVRWGGEPTLTDLTHWGMDIQTLPAQAAAQILAVTLAQERLTHHGRIHGDVI